jgi:dihydrofolate reductase
LAGPGGALDWLHYSPDVQQIMTEYWRGVDTILMGRKTYVHALAQQPLRQRSRRTTRTKTAPPKMRTYVFSRTLPAMVDPGVELVAADAAEFVRTLKGAPGGDICLMGGGELAQALLAAGLVDAVGLNIHPVLLGGGVPVFRDPGHRVSLQLTTCRPLDGGCILATYDVKAA